MGVVAADVGLDEVAGAVALWDVVMISVDDGSSRGPEESRCCWASCCNRHIHLAVTASSISHLTSSTLIPLTCHRPVSGAEQQHLLSKAKG